MPTASGAGRHLCDLKCGFERFSLFVKFASLGSGTLCSGVYSIARKSYYDKAYRKCQKSDFSLNPPLLMLPEGCGF